jgi:hypothetical protein
MWTVAQAQSEEAERDDLPLRVVPGWGGQVRRAARLCRLIDRHLKTTTHGRHPHDQAPCRPGQLSAEQRIQLVTDIYDAITVP